MDDQTEKEKSVAARGNWGRVIYAARPDGTMPALVYVQALPDKDGARIRALFQIMAYN